MNTHAPVWTKFKRHFALLYIPNNNHIRQDIIYIEAVHI